MRGLRRNAPRVAALALWTVSTPFGVAQAFTPTSDGRFIHTDGGTPTPTRTPPAPFEPFSASVTVLMSGLPVGSSSQSSSIPADGIVGQGNAGFSSFLPLPGAAQSVLDVGFDLSLAFSRSTQPATSMSSAAATARLACSASRRPTRCSW